MRHVNQFKPTAKQRAAGSVSFGKVVLAGEGEGSTDMNFFFNCEFEQKQFEMLARERGYLIKDAFFGYGMNTRADYALTCADLMSSRLARKENEPT